MLLVFTHCIPPALCKTSRCWLPKWSMLHCPEQYVSWQQNQFWNLLHFHSLLASVKIIGSSFVYKMENQMIKYICIGLGIIYNFIGWINYSVKYIYNPTFSCFFNFEIIQDSQEIVKIVQRGPGCSSPSFSHWLHLT